MVLLRIIAVLVLFLSVTICMLQALVAVTAMQHPDTAGPVPALFVPPLLTLVAGLALSGLLEGVARLLAREGSTASPSSAAPAGLKELSMAINQLQNTLPALAEELRNQVATATTPVAVATEDPHSLQCLERIFKLLEEMKELTMLDDSQRQGRRQQAMARRKSSRLEEVAKMIHRREWAEADALLHLLESLHPDDPEVAARRSELADARIVIQTSEWETLATQVQDLLAVNNYEEATAVATQFLERYPDHTDGVQLLDRVKQDHAVYVERTVARMYDEIKAAVEAHQWRNALAAIQQFLTQFPDHVRAHKLRPQVRVIQKNAEIEERHELEDRIRERINSRKYTEAADLSEDLLNRFPESAQAAYLADLLPKLRERAGSESTGATLG
jgi:outer membrane protein assembly factor BamD (BamD/ComL family)